MIAFGVAANLVHPATGYSIACLPVALREGLSEGISPGHVQATYRMGFEVAANAEIALQTLQAKLCVVSVRALKVLQCNLMPCASCSK